MAGLFSAGPEGLLSKVRALVLFEFQHRTAAGEWESLGIAQTPGERFDLSEAAVILRSTRGGWMPRGAYRVRAIELIPRWQAAEVDEHGVFRRLDS